jgi:hypothetical protein
MARRFGSGETVGVAAGDASGLALAAAMACADAVGDGSAETAALGVALGVALGIALGVATSAMGEAAVVVVAIGEAGSGVRDPNKRSAPTAMTPTATTRAAMIRRVRIVMRRPFVYGRVRGPSPRVLVRDSCASGPRSGAVGVR